MTWCVVGKNERRVSNNAYEKYYMEAADENAENYNKRSCTTPVAPEISISATDMPCRCVAVNAIPLLPDKFDGPIEAGSWQLSSLLCPLCLSYNLGPCEGLRAILGHLYFLREASHNSHLHCRREFSSAALLLASHRAGPRGSFGSSPQSS